MAFNLESVLNESKISPCIFFSISSSNDPFTQVAIFSSIEPETIFSFGLVGLAGLAAAFSLTGLAAFLAGDFSFLISATEALLSKISLSKFLTFSDLAFEFALSRKILNVSSGISLIVIAVIVGAGVLLYTYVIKPHNKEKEAAQAIIEFDKTIEEDNELLSQNKPIQLSKRRL